MRTSESVAHASTRIRDAVHLEPPVLRWRVASAYRAVMGVLERLGRHPVRFWNFVPGIGDRILTDLDRYMVFNAGRYDAYADRYGGNGLGNDHLATASAVGITGSDLSIHCLAMERPGIPVENPRQTPAWQYSTRYGPRPPCFSRGTIVDLAGRRTLLIGGTSSVVGEDSRHARDFERQLDETLVNLEALVRTAAADARDVRPALHRLIDLRVYVTSADYAKHLHTLLLNRCPHARTIDLVVAQVCRPELLVEIEGIAEI